MAIEVSNSGAHPTHDDDDGVGTPNKRIACIECRQQKVRCDAHEHYPNPCSRCTKKKTGCVLQADFKRTSKRRRMMELEQEMAELKKNVETQESARKRIATGSLLELGNTALVPSDPTTLTTSSVSSMRLPLPEKNGTGDDLPMPLFVPPVEPEASYESIPPVEDLKCEPKSIEGVTLSSLTIQNLFREFVEHYHPFMPVVDVAKGPERIYRLCPTLFWTIMAVASRRFDQDKELMMKLAPMLKNILAEITISPVSNYVSGDPSEPAFNVASVYSVQAFLIYTMWPPLTSSISADSSWNAAGVAVFGAIRVGLHCPGYARDFTRVKADNRNYPKIAEQIKTWVCCNVASQSVATVFGFPSFTSFDASVMAACSKESGLNIPEPIAQMMKVQHLENEVEKTLNSNAQDPLGLSELSERLSLIQIMNRKLDELQMTIGAMDDYRRFNMLLARVHLMSYYFLDNGGFSTLQLQKGLVQAYNSALALMHHTDEAVKRNPNFMRYLPGIHVQAIWQCSAIVLKVYHSSFGAFVDGHAGKELYFRSVHHMSQASILKHDMAYRGAEIMQQLWQLFENLAQRNAATARINIRTRMAASVFFDILWTMREECGIRSVAPAVLNERNRENAVPSPQKIYDGPSQQINHQQEFELPHIDAMNPALFEWDVDVAWRDVDLMMTDFGFHAEEAQLD